MLSAADARLVQQDRHIPALPVLLDPDAFTETLQRLYPDGAVQSAHPEYVRYKKGTSCLVGYRVCTDSGTVTAYARGHGPAAGLKMDKAAQRESVPSALGDGIRIVDESSMLVCPFPNDHELRALQSLADPEQRREMLRSVLGDRADLVETPLEPLRYKPERRFVARLAGTDGPDAVLKFYTRDDFQRTSASAAAFDSEPPLRVPLGLGVSKPHRLAAIEWLDGTSLRDALAGGAAGVRGCATLGAALARIHAQKPRGLRFVYTAEDFAASLTETAGALSELVPEVGDRARALAERVGERLVRRHWRARRAIHGDFSADQVVVQEDGVGVIDFDRAGRGDPRLDLAAFRARLECDVLAGELKRGDADRCFAALLDAYRDTSEKDVTRRLDRFTAGRLLLCAVEPFRHRAEDWPARIEQIVARAEEIAADGLVPA